MPSDIEIGQVLSLKIRFNNCGTISLHNHPYLIVGINDDFDVIEIAQLDSLKGKEYKATFRSNCTVLCDNPKEYVIDEDSFLQMDNTFQIENYPDICKYRRQCEKLTLSKLKKVLSEYQKYHTENEIDENKQVFIDQEELEKLNK
jgi:hypothetical protein